MVDGEVLPRITFAEFWNASRVNSAIDDKQGPARKRWQKLPVEDLNQIAWAIEREGAIDLNGQWACTWLDHRCWTEPVLSRSGDEFLSDTLSAFRANRRRRIVMMQVGSPAFEAEYDRRIRAGEPVLDMDFAVKRGAGTFTAEINLDER